MGIFDNYDNLSPNYIPNNMNVCEPAEEAKSNKPPRIIKNTKGQFLGYCWYNGEKFNFTVNTNYKEDEVQRKSLKLIITNFRGDFIIDATSTNDTSVTLSITDEVNSLMRPGIYRGVLQLISDSSVEFEQLFNIAVL